MAVLSDPDRVTVWAKFMQDTSAARETFGAMSKVDLRAAVNAIDVWVDANAAAFNSAIPQPARGVLTAKQKAWLLMAVVNKRFEVS